MDIPVTVGLLGTLAFLLLLSCVANAVFLQLGSRWAKIPNVTFRRALAAVVVASLVNWIPLPVLGLLAATELGQTIIVVGLQFAFCLGLTCLVYAKVLRTTMRQAAVAWLPTLIPGATLIAITFCVVRPWLFEPFKTPANSMAPTILGRHWEAPCPRCGSPAYCSPEDNRVSISGRPVPMVCSKERRQCEVVDPPHTVHSRDRFIVCKYLQPKRWDVIVFRLPEDPKTIHCQRLVGLPGETVTIRDGAIWIDGKKQTPPESCKGIEYLDRIEGVPMKLWGSEAKPAKLGSDEYFVLGDFSARAMDSRLWQQGAPGHAPYAVPASCIVGVVTHIYWPWDRCRALR
jgi:signal peptidase I